ncbi:penicillin-binding protein, partial [Burkholderia gladioli]
VATAGTGAGSNVLGRGDLQGKTGTTNDAKDGWFAGYQQSLVAVAWMGYDQPKSLGSREFGAQLALPIWVNYMRTALRGVPEQQMAMPDGLTTIDGELYFADHTPGNGFVSNVDINEAGNPINANDALGAAGAAGLTPPPVTQQERQQIMDMFEGNKP